MKGRILYTREAEMFPWGFRNDRRKQMVKKYGTTSKKEGEKKWKKTETSRIGQRSMVEVRRYLYRSLEIPKVRLKQPIKEAK